MFPSQSKIELFARKNFKGWDNWGLEIPESKIEILSALETSKTDVADLEDICRRHTRKEWN